MKELASAASVGAHKCLCKQYYFCMVSSCILDKVCMHATGKVCKLILYLCMYEPITAHLLCWWMCVCVRVCVHVWPLCVLWTSSNHYGKCTLFIVGCQDYYQQRAKMGWGKWKAGGATEAHFAWSNKRNNTSPFVTIYSRIRLLDILFLSI